MRTHLGNRMSFQRPWEVLGAILLKLTRFQYPWNNAARGGFFCLPVDSAHKETLINNAGLADRNKIYNSFDTILISLLTSLLAALIFFLLVQFFPKTMNYATVIGGVVVLLATLVCISTYPSDQVGVKIALGVTMGLLLIIILISCWQNRDSLRMNTIFLR